LYEGNVSLASKYLGRGATAVNSNKLGGYSASSFHLKNNNIIVSKANSWLSLDSPSSGSGYNQSAGISIGESGYKGRNAVHLTYAGTGVSYLGMGYVNGSNNKPANAVLQMNVGSNNAHFLGDIYEKGVKLEDKYQAKGGNEVSTLIYDGGWYGLNSGDIRLTRSFRSFDRIVVIGSNDSRDWSASYSFTPSDYDKAYAVKGRHNPNRVVLFGSRTSQWFGYFSSNTFFKYLTDADARISKIYGITNG
jgi:hypothetical protein